jgi:hypothetical protein
MNRPHTGAKRSKGKSYFPALAALCLGLLWPTIAESQVGVLTYHNDNDRTGQNLNETLLAPANVNRFRFGKLFAHNVDSRVYAQPLYVPNVSIGGRTHNVVYVATEHNTVYAFDADSNSGANAFPLWSVNLGPSVQAEQPIAPEVGITGTPVIDATTGTLYVVSFTFEAGSYAYRLHALDWATGNEEFGGPVQVRASVPGTGTCSSGGAVVFDAANLFQRPGLLLSDGVVYIGWTDLSRGCANGWLIGYDAHTLVEVGAFNTTPNAEAAGIWQSGAAPAGDASGNIYVETGDGTFDGLADFGDTLLKLKLSSGLAVSDYFTPHNQDCMASNDQDLGSGAPVLLPDQPGAHPHLAVASDKLGTIYLVDRDNLGHYNTNCSTKCDPQIVQELFAVLGGGAQEAPCHGRGGEFGMPAYWNSTLYFLGPGLAKATDSLKAFSLTNGLLSTAPNSESAMKFSFPGATPSISANGLMDGIVWLLDNSGYNGNPAVLYAYDATNLADLLYASNQVTGRDEPGIAVKFTVPTVANGKVYVAGKRQLAAYGPLTISVVPISLTFASQIVNKTSLAQTVQLTNNQTTDLSISSITATADYLQVNSCGSSLPPGANCRINVAFKPSVSGTINGALTIIDSVNSVNKPQIVNLTGTGTSPLTLSPPYLTFGAVQVGTTSPPMTITATNNLNKAVTLSIAMSGDYAETNPCGGSIAATETCKITVTFTPTNTGSISGAVTITDSLVSTPQVVNLSGSGSGTVSSTVRLSPTSLEFSGQLVGTRSTVKTVTLMNTGSTTLNISNVTASGNYSQTNTCGNSVAPRGECTLSVTFTPEVVAGIIGALTIFDNANTTPQVVSLSGRGLSPAAISPGALTFAGQYVGTRSTSRFITLTNNKAVSLSITSIAASRDYAQTNTCGTSLAAHGTCEITVIFTPTKLGSVNGAITIKDSASNSPQVVGLTGLGVGPVTVSPTRLTFPTQKVGSTSTPKEVTLTNNRMTALAVDAISTFGDFAETNTCGGSLAAHASCTVSVTFTPSTAGARSASLIITDGSVSSPEVVDLLGTGD